MKALVEKSSDPLEVAIKEENNLTLVWCRSDYDEYYYHIKGKKIQWLGADFKYEGRIITGPEIEELISDLCKDQNAQALWINTNLDKVIIARAKEEE